MFYVFQKCENNLVCIEWMKEIRFCLIRILFSIKIFCKIVRKYLYCLMYFCLNTQYSD